MLQEFEVVKVQVAWDRQGGLHKGHGSWDLERWWELRWLCAAPSMVPKELDRTELGCLMMLGIQQ